MDRVGCLKCCLRKGHGSFRIGLRAMVLRSIQHRRPRCSVGSVVRRRVAIFRLVVVVVIVFFVVIFVVIIAIASGVALPTRPSFALGYFASSPLCRRFDVSCFVAAEMAIEGSATSEFFAATGNTTSVRPLSRMCSSMPREGAAVRKALVASRVIAHVRSLASVNPLMDGECRALSNGGWCVSDVWNGSFAHAVLT